MLVAISIQRIDPSREDVYLASVDDQERVIAESPDFMGRTVLRSQTEPGRYWLIDEWREESAMRLALAMARTFATVAALVDDPLEVLAEGERLAFGEDPATSAGGLFLAAEGWIKELCLDDYLATIGEQARRLAAEPGFRRRLMLVDRTDPLHRWVLDEWSGEQAAYNSYERNPVTEGEALRFLTLFAERGNPLVATPLRAEANTLKER